MQTSQSQQWKTEMFQSTDTDKFQPVIIYTDELLFKNVKK